MTKPFYLFILFIALTLASCKVDEPSFRGFTVIDPVESYLPFTKGSTWIYEELVPDKEPTTVTLTATSKTIKADGKFFVEITRKGGSDSSSAIYYNFNNHQYTIKTAYFLAETVEQLILNDTASVDKPWISKYSDSGFHGADPAQVKGHVVAKNLTMNVYGNNYTNVIRTQVELQSSVNGAPFATFRAYDYYFVKGIGIIQIDVQSEGRLEAVTRLISYKINTGNQ